MAGRYLIFVVALLAVSGCASLNTERLAGHLTSAMLDQSDPEIVRAGAPAYLLLLDSLIADEPDNTDLLLAGARLYGSYAMALVDDPDRRLNLTAKAREYATRALCRDHGMLCTALDRPFLEFEPVLKQIGADDTAMVYGYSIAWLGWIQARAGDWNAVAELPKAEGMLERVAQIDPAYDNGRAQLYLATLQALRPAALGGKPEQARQHFELALQYSGERDLTVKLEYARRYARLVFDQSLHDRLLREVLAADPIQPGLTLSNVMAQREARALLKDEYF